MDSKVPPLSPFNYADWKPKMSTYLKRQCLFDVSIGALSESESYEENIDWINNDDRFYGIMFFGMSPNIHHLIDSTGYPFELWKILEKYLVSHTVHVPTTLFDSNASSFNEEENIEAQFFFCVS